MTDEPKPLTKAQIQTRIAETLGFKPAPPDHPIYAGGATITFLNFGREPLEKAKKPKKDKTT